MAKRFLKFILILALGQMGASCNGTETGNPQHTGGSSGCPALKEAPKDDSLSTKALDDLIFDLCQKIISCGVVSTETCVNTLNGPDGDLMTDQLGLPIGTTIDQLRSELISGAVTVSVTAEPVCISDIGTITCEMVTANISSSDFSGVQNIIPSSCVSAFTPIPGSADGPAPTTGGCP